MKSKRNNYLPPDNMVSNFFGEKKMNERITSDPQVCGGEPCVKETRIPVRIIIKPHCFRRGLFHNPETIPTHPATFGHR